MLVKLVRQKGVLKRLDTAELIKIKSDIQEGKKFITFSRLKVLNIIEFYIILIYIRIILKLKTDIT